MLGLAASPDVAHGSSQPHLRAELRIRAESTAGNKRLGANPSGGEAATQRCCCIIYHRRFSGARKLVAPGRAFLGERGPPPVCVSGQTGTEYGSGRDT